jgi:hypothetical protein
MRMQHDQGDAMSTATIIELSSRRPSPTRPSRFNQHLLNVTFESANGGRRSAFGGGETVAEAVAAARAELPSGDWTVARWAPVYGE